MFQLLGEVKDEVKELSHQEGEEGESRFKSPLVTLDSSKESLQEDPRGGGEGIW
jgi:hypothetical protein